MEIVKCLKDDKNLYEINSVVKVVTQTYDKYYGRIIDLNINNSIVKIDCSTYFHSELVELNLREIKEINFYPNSEEMELKRILTQNCR